MRPREADNGYTHLLGCHPILATWADAREALHIRLRKGSANTQKRIKRFCEELISRLGRTDPVARPARLHRPRRPHTAPPAARHPPVD